MNITISGDLGSGKSAVSKILKLKGYDYVTVGELFRQEAEKRGVSVEQLNKLAETDASIDKLVDNMQFELGKTKDMTVFDSRLSFLFVPNSYKVYLTVHLDEAAKRIFADKSRISEQHTSLEGTKEDILMRRQLEITRYKNKYKVDYSDYKNYDLVIDTTSMTPDEVVYIIMGAIRAEMHKVAFICPNNVYPTKGVEDLDSVKISDYKQDLHDDLLLHAIDVVQMPSNSFCVVKGHNRLMASLMEYRTYIRAKINQQRGNTSTDISLCQEFERKGRFKYKYYPQ